MVSTPALRRKRPADHSITPCVCTLCCQQWGRRRGIFYGFVALSQLPVAAEVSGPRVRDARIAALCIYSNVRELVSVNRDFSHFGSAEYSHTLVPA